MFASLVNESKQLYKNVKVGFSWTEMIFGFWTPVFRGDFKWASVLVLLEIIFGSFTWGGGAFLVTFVFAFFYNRFYVKDMVAQGYKPADETSANILKTYRYI
jgi:hypothetical protein